MSTIPHSYYYDQQPVPCQPVSPPPPVRPPRRRRGGLVFLFVLIAIGVLTSVILLLGGVKWTLALPESLQDSFPSLFTEPPQDFMDDYMEDFMEPAPSAAPTTVERAPTGDGTTLTITPAAGGEALSYQEIYRRNIPSIVSIRGYTSDGMSLGTGVVLSEDGYIITNAHVIEGSYEVEILLYDDSTYNALLVGMDTESDLAVLKIDARDLTPAQFGDSDQLQVGDTALAIGNPLGEELRGTMTDGIISAINRDVNVDGRSMVLLQTTAALNSGNSGGALINDHGQVIGITTLKMSSYYDTIEGLGFAIPTTTVKGIVDALIAQGYVSGRPTIGITVNTYPVETEDGATGLQVIEVDPMSNAWDAGVQADDIILAANGRTISAMEDLEEVRDQVGVGGTLTLEILREGETLTISFELVDRYTLDS